MLDTFLMLANAQASSSMQVRPITLVLTISAGVGLGAATGCQPSWCGDPFDAAMTEAYAAVEARDAVRVRAAGKPSH